MKTLEQFYNEVAASEELQKEFATVSQESAEAIVAFAKKYGCETTKEEVKAFFEKKIEENGELSEAELDAVAGGKSGNVILLSIGSFGLACAFLSLTDVMQNGGKCEGIFS